MPIRESLNAETSQFAAPTLKHSIRRSPGLLPLLREMGIADANDRPEDQRQKQGDKPRHLLERARGDRLMLVCKQLLDVETPRSRCQMSPQRYQE